MYSMNIIYLHGFQSSSLSIKGQLLKRYCESRPQWHVHLPDLNMPPHLADMFPQTHHVENIALLIKK